MDNSPVTNHSSSVSKRPHYDVFLSFRGADTRNNFASFLHSMLHAELFNVFIDEEDLEKGKNIKDELIEAINHSMISIPIISKNYASSKSCLMELVHMLKRMDENNHIVIPIFYFIDPSDVRHCNGPFATSLLGCNHSHTDSALKRIPIIGPYAMSLLRKDGHIDDAVIGPWKSALEQIADVAGYNLNETNAVNRVGMIKQIIRDVRKKLKREDLIGEDLVAVDHHVQSIMEMLKVDYRDGQAVAIDETLTKVLVIHGITGVGKTVLAKHVYNKLCPLYDYCSFCGQIQAENKHNEIVPVQNKLISALLKRNADKFDCPEKALTHIKLRFGETKVLLLLDDVKDDEQLSALVGELDWLALGSRVIVTSQGRDVLTRVYGAESFFLGPLEKVEAMTLFCRHAFPTSSPSGEFEKLSDEIVDATGLLPFVLKLVGSSLSCYKRKREWNEMLKALKASKAGPQETVQAALKKSYTKLNKSQRQMFLDIACFCSGKDVRIPYYMWDDSGFFPSHSIKALDAWSFVKIGENRELCMHEILKNFGREIIKSKYPHTPWKHSRLCDHKEALRVLREGKGTDRVLALRLEFGNASERPDIFKYYQFKKLESLRFLKLDRAGIQGNFQKCFSSLRWLDWQGAPRIFEVRLENLQELLILDLSESQVHKDWRGWDLLKEARKLKVLKLTNCIQLIDTPIFPASMELERLILEGCSTLTVINQSSNYLGKLVSLNLKQCNRLCTLPNLGLMTELEELVIDGTSISHIDFQEGSMKKLETLSACDCKLLIEISDLIGYLETLEYLALDNTGIHTLPESIESMKVLKTLSLKNCQGITHLPNGIGKLESLQFLDLSDTLIRELPPIEDWKAMKVLRMKSTFIEEFPTAILNLENLKEIDFSYCCSLKGSIQGLDILRLSNLAILKLSYTHISLLPEGIHRLPRLQEVHIVGCDNLQIPPQLPSEKIRGGS